MSATRRPRLLLIGPRARPGQPVGGAQVSFEELLREFHASGTFELDVIDTTRGSTYSRGPARALGNALALLRVLSALVRRGASADLVMLNASVHGLVGAGPWIQRACRWHGRPLVVRAFGGALDLALDAAPPARRRRLRDVLRSSALVLLQTEQLCRHFEGSGNLRRLPTTRRLADGPRSASQDCRRFLFLAQLRPEKGYEDALRAIELCPAGCTLDIYGPALPGTDLARLRSSARARYHGELAHDQVASVLASHDALVFPSHYPGEGLPGSVVEALQAGMPVIASRWRALPELVEHERNGLLVPARDPAALAAAMTRLAEDPALFLRLRAEALSRGRELDATAWQRRLESWLLALCQRDIASLPSATRCSEASP